MPPRRVATIEFSRGFQPTDRKHTPTVPRRVATDEFRITPPIGSRRVATNEFSRGFQPTDRGFTHDGFQPTDRTHPQRPRHVSDG